MYSAHLCKNGDRRNRRGAAATEFALIAPLLILFALASMDFGRIAYYAIVVSNAARTGAEVGGTRRFTSETEALWESKIQAAVLQEMQNLPDFHQSELETKISYDKDSDNVVRVTVGTSYPFRTLVNWPVLPSEITLREQVQYRQFR